MNDLFEEFISYGGVYTLFETLNQHSSHYEPGYKDTYEVLEPYQKWLS